MLFPRAPQSAQTRVHLPMVSLMMSRRRCCVSGRAIIAVVALAVFVVGLSSAHADRISDASQKLDSLSAEVGRLSSGIRPVSEVASSSPDIVGRRLVNAQLDFSVGNYDAAAVTLYEIVDRYPNHPAADEALYYLAESLFQKGDAIASRTYFTQLVSAKGASSKFFRQSLERLVELSLVTGDSQEIERWFAALDQISGLEQQSSIPYVRGKYYYSKADYAQAGAQFARVTNTSKYYLQARYFLGVTHTANGDLDKAAQVFQSIVGSPGKTKEEQRIVELAHMAIGRLYYERGQMTRAIDSYLNIERRSDLFADALYEAAWVYVKNKEFNKALRALELLALSDPNSYRLPEVRILEANLRIRRAQALEESSAGSPEEEYGKAKRLFESTHSAFDEPHQALVAIVNERRDPRLFLEQITGRQSTVFATQATIPSVAAAWLRREPEVKRIVAVESDLAQIENEISEAETIIVRLDRALNSPSRVNIFPSLAEKRIRGTEILEELLTVRATLAAEGKRHMAGASPADKAEMERLAAARSTIQARLKALPDAAAAYGERVTRAKANFDQLDQAAAVVSTEIQLAEAQLVAMERYLASGSAAVEGEKRDEVEAGMVVTRNDIDNMREQLAAIRRDIILGRDQAGTDDFTAREEERLRGELRTALDAEAQFILGRGANPKLAAAMAKSSQVMAMLDAMFSKIDGIVDAALVEVRSDLDAEKIKLAAYKQEFANYETESAVLGSEVLGGSFNNVVDKFYQILIRTDVGVVDISWSRQEEADRRERRLTLDRAREMRTIQTEFSDVLREIEEEKAREQEAAAKEKEAAAKKEADKDTTTDGPPVPNISEDSASNGGGGSTEQSGNTSSEGTNQ